MFTQANSPANLEGYPQEAIEEVSINNLPAKLVSGTLNRVYSETGEELQDPTWIEEPYTISLYWSDSGTFYTLRFYAGWRGDMRLSTESLLQIAESVQ